MNLGVREFLGIIAAVLSILGYIPYVLDSYKGKTTPHLFSWLLWTLLNTIVFVFLMLEGGGPAAWPIGATSLMFGFILYFATKSKARSRIGKIDLLMFLLGLGAIPIWLLADNPVLAIIIVSFIEVLAFLPTLRKTLKFPFEETLASYIIAIIKYSLVLLILENYIVSLLINPLMWWIINVFFVLLLLVLRKRIQNAGTT